MKHRFLLPVLIAVTCLLIPQKGHCGFGWDAETNESLYNHALEYMQNVLTELVGEPYYYMVEETMQNMKAVHSADQYVWMDQINRLCNTLTNIYGPSISHGSLSDDKYERMRRHIFLIRDFAMHSNDRGQFDKYCKKYIYHKCDEFFAYMENNKPQSGEIQIVKLYSAGFFVRTGNASLALDVSWDWGMYDNTRKLELVPYINAYFISHAHDDHYDETLIEEACKKEVPMVMTKEIGNSGSYQYAGKEIWTGERTSPLNLNINGKAVSVTSGYGAQTDEPCLLYVIEVDGWRITHLGDNNQHDAESFYDGQKITDVVLCPIFNGLNLVFPHTMAGSNTDNVQQLYINCHENEHVHGVESRVSMRYFYNYSYTGWGSTSYPCGLLMDNAEIITLTK